MFAIISPYVAIEYQEKILRTVIVEYLTGLIEDELRDENKKKSVHDLLINKKECKKQERQGYIKLLDINVKYGDFIMTSCL